MALQLTLKSTSRTHLFIAAGALLFGFIITIGVLLSFRATYAATPPDSCFSVSGGAIMSYYDNEGDLPENPACPKNVDIPSTIAGQTITTVTAGGFYGKGLTAVTLPSTLTTIDSGAFGNNSLTSVTLPASIETISGSGFSDNELTSITLPEGLTTLSSGSFANNNITSISIPASLSNLSSGIFSGNPLASIHFADGYGTIAMGHGLCPSDSSTISVSFGTSNYSGPATTIIDDSAFTDCNITSLYLGRTVQSIGYNAFSYNDFTSLTIPSSVTSVGQGAFAYSSALQNVVIDAPLTIIEQSTFDNSTQLTTVTLPPTLTTIGAQAFQATNIANITFPNSLQTIDFNAFFESALTSVTLPDSVQTLNNNAFLDNNITSLTIGNGLTSPLTTSRFAGNPIKTITIGTPDYTGPAHTVLDTAAFADIAELKTVTLNPVVGDVNSNAFNGSGVEEVTLTGNAVYGSSAFNSTSLNNVTINGNPSLGNYLFAYSPLQTMTINGNPSFATETFQFIIDGSQVENLDWDEQLQYTQDNGAFVRIFATNPTFISTYGPGAVTASQNLSDETFTTGGYIINPATYSVTYTDTSTNQQLSPELASGTGPELQSYLFSDNPTSDFSQYYRTGDSVNFTIPSFDGYVSPARATSQTLGVGNTVIALAYAPVGAGGTGATDGNGAPTAPNTGFLGFAQSAGSFIVASIMPIVLAVTLVAALAFAAYKFRSHRQ